MKNTKLFPLIVFEMSCEQPIFTAPSGMIVHDRDPNMGRVSCNRSLRKIRINCYRVYFQLNCIWSCLYYICKILLREKQVFYCFKTFLIIHLVRSSKKLRILTCAPQLVYLFFSQCHKSSKKGPSLLTIMFQVSSL